MLCFSNITCDKHDLIKGLTCDKRINSFQKIKIPRHCDEVQC